MKPDILALMCDPTTHERLEVTTAPDARGRLQECLVSLPTGRRFPIREGIPIFLHEGDISGANQRYQKMYDLFAPFYDFSTWLYAHWKGIRVEACVREYLAAEAGHEAQTSARGI